MELMQKDTVKHRMNRKEPKNPPAIVMVCVDAKVPRKTCIAANNKTKSDDDNKQDVPVEIAKREI